MSILAATKIAYNRCPRVSSSIAATSILTRGVGTAESFAAKLRKGRAHDTVTISKSPAKVVNQLPCLRAYRLDAGLVPERLHGLSLHLRVARDVAPGRGNADVAEVIADHRHVGT